MPVRVTKTRIDQEAALARLVSIFAPRLEIIGERIAENAKKNLKSQGAISKPRGTDSRGGKVKEPGSRIPAEPIVMSGFQRSRSALTPAQQKLRKEIVAMGVPEVAFRAALKNGMSHAEVSAAFAPLFRFRKGGGKPSAVVLQGGVLRGVRETRTKPHLIDTIRSEGVELRGNRLHLTVAARSDHANLVEFGFHHKGGGDIPARPFLLPALKSEEEGLKSGSSLKG